MAENHTFTVRGDDGEEYGPVDLPELREWVRENRAGLGTKVRLDAPGELWQPWQYYPELVALLAEVRATGAELAGVVLAPFGRRILAALADLILSFGLIVPLVMVSLFLLPADLIAQLLLQNIVPQNPAPQAPLWFVRMDNAICLGVALLYYAGFYAAHGRTPAKSVMRLRVVDAQGRPPGFVQSLLRALVFIVSVYVFCGIPLIYAFFNPQRRALHDIVAGTYVVEM